MIEWIKLGWDVFKDIKNWWDKKSKPYAPIINSSPEAVAQRFISLFEHHGVQRSQIPAFFGRDLQLKDFKNTDTLIDKLSDPVLHDACELFGVRREWLDGVDEDIYELHDFYKHPEGYRTYLNDLLTENASLEGELWVFDELAATNPALLLLKEQCGEVGDRIIYRYHLCSGWLYNYWKCRAYLTACVAIAWKKEVYIYGRKISGINSGNIVEGRVFMDDWISAGKRSHWEADDLFCKPELYLDGVDEGMFGQEAALSLFLELEQKGYMESCFGQAPRADFEKALAEVRASEPKGLWSHVKRLLL